jgi:hypothetical protein
MSSADKTKLDAITGTNTGDQTITLTGNVTGSGTGSFAATIANDAVDNTKLSNMAQSTLKGRATASTGDPEDLSASQVRTILNVADGAEVNVQSNWTEANSGSDAFILNKPTLGTAAAAATTDFAAAVHAHAASDVTTGTFDNARINFAAPAAIGSATRNSGAFTTLSAAPTSGSALTLTGGTVTASAPLISATQTWNNAAVTFTGLAATITNTLSNAASLVARLTVGSTNVFEVDGRGFTKVRKVSTSTDFASVFEVLRGTTSVVRLRDDGDVNANSFGVTTAGNVIMNSGGVGVQSTARFGFSDGAFAGTTDTDLRRDAADTLAQRRGLSPQRFNLYGQFTTTTNFERLFLEYNSTATAFRIGTEKGTSGSARALELSVNGNRRIYITDSGQVGIGSTTGALASHGLFVDVPASNSTLTSGGVTIRGTTSVTLDNGGDPILRVQSSRVMFGGTTNLFPALKRSSTALQVRLADDTAFAPLECAGLTLNGDLTASTRNIVTDTTTGTKIGTSTSQKIGFFDKTPVVQPTAVADATDAATVITQLNALLSRMRDLGLIAT